MGRCTKLKSRWSSWASLEGLRVRIVRTVGVGFERAAVMSWGFRAFLGRPTEVLEYLRHVWCTLTLRMEQERLQSNDEVKAVRLIDRGANNICINWPNCKGPEPRVNHAIEVLTACTEK